MDLSRLILVIVNIFFPSDLESTHTNGFSIFHVNIRSIRKNFKKLYELITTIKQPFDVLALSETWVSDIDAIDDYNIDGYTAIYQNRQDREGGGVCIFINSLSFDFQFVECMSYKDTFNNILTIKLTPKFQHDINKSKRRDRQKLFTVCYRSPDTDNNSFINNLTPILTKIHRTNKPSYIIGDMNYNIVNTNHHQPTQTYYTLLTALMYQQVINKPTRITETSSTIIDHIWHNDVTNGYDSQHNRSGILYSNISDHLPIFFQITSNKTRNIKVKVVYRQFSNDNFNAYKEKLSAIKTGDYLKMNDVNKTHTQFCENLVNIIHKCFPLKEKFIRQKTLNNKWLSKSLLKEIKLKNRLFAKKLKFPIQKNIDDYHSQLKIVEKNKKIEKRTYFKEQLEKYNTNIKKKWDVLREIILRKRKRSDISFIEKDNTIITDKNKISEVFVDYFQSIGSSLAEKFKNISTRKFERWLYRSPRPPEVFKQPTVYPEDVTNIINNLDSSKGAGADEISPKLLKEGKDQLNIHLTNIFNLSIIGNMSRVP